MVPDPREKFLRFRNAALLLVLIGGAGAFWIGPPPHPSTADAQPERFSRTRALEGPEAPGPAGVPPRPPVVAAPPAPVADIPYIAYAIDAHPHGCRGLAQDMLAAVSREGFRAVAQAYEKACF